MTYHIAKEILGPSPATRSKKKVKSNKDPNIVLVPPATTSTQSSAIRCSGKTTKSDMCTQPEQKSEDRTEKELKDVKMPPKMLKRGRRKGAELTVIGLPRAKKAKKGILPFSKVLAEEKNRILLECFVRRSVANKAIRGEKLISVEVETNIHNIPDMVRDKEMLFLAGLRSILLQMHGKSSKCK